MTNATAIMTINSGIENDLMVSAKAANNGIGFMVWIPSFLAFAFAWKNSGFFFHDQMAAHGANDTHALTFRDGRAILRTGRVGQILALHGNSDLSRTVGAEGDRHRAATTHGRVRRNQRRRLLLVEDPENQVH